MLMQQLSDSNKSAISKSASNLSGSRTNAALVHQTFHRVLPFSHHKRYL